MSFETLTSEARRATPIGDLPESWDVIPLGAALTQAQYGLSVRGEKQGRYPILRMNCQEKGRVLFRDLQFVNLDAGTFETFRLKEGDILFNRTNSHELVGRSAIFEDSRPAVFASYLLRLTTDRTKLLPDFLNYYLASPAAQAVLKSFATRGVSQSNISATKLRVLEVPRPPLEEQRAIAGVLSKLQARVELQGRVVATLKELKAATMAKLFREGLRGKPLRQSEIGEIPANWNVVLFGRVVDIAEGQVDPRVEPYASMLHVGPEDIEEGTGRLLKPRTARDLGLISGKYAFQKRNIVFSKIRPYLQKSVLVDFEGICSADMYPLRPSSDFDGQFVHALTLSPIFTAQAVSQQDRTGIPKLNREQLRSIRVPQPSQEEQQEIGQLFAAIDRRLVIAMKYDDLLKSTFRSLLRALMTGQLRVEAPAIEAKHHG